MPLRARKPSVAARMLSWTKLGMSREKMFVNLDRYGNPSAAAVAIALDEANRTGRIKPGDYVLMIVFGGGLTWASTIIEW